MARLAPSDNSDNDGSDVDTIARQARIYRVRFLPVNGTPANDIIKCQRAPWDQDLRRGPMQEATDGDGEQRLSAGAG